MVMIGLSNGCIALVSAATCPQRFAYRARIAARNVTGGAMRAGTPQPLWGEKVRIRHKLPLTDRHSETTFIQA